MNTGPNNQPAYDYAIVGSGAGGGPLAGNLAKAGQKVLLPEAGSDYEDYNYQVPAFHALATEDENLRFSMPVSIAARCSASSETATSPQRRFTKRGAAQLRRATHTMCQFRLWKPLRLFD